MSAIVADIAHETMVMKFMAIARDGNWSRLPLAQQHRHAILAERQTLRKRLAECATNNNTVFVHRHGRDCDGVTHSRLVEFPANIDGYTAAVDNVLEWADGPEYFDILTPEQATRFQPEPQRDLNMEAFENGHPHVIYV